MEGIEQLVKLAQPKGAFTHRPSGLVHEFYLTGTITSAEDYIDWFDTIRHATENDLIKIYINSEGGNLFTAVQFMRVLTDCPGTVWISVEGACMSAATMIMLCGDAYEISPHSMFMFHNYSGGTVGKGGEMYDNIVYERKWSERLLREIYTDFLTEEEIEMMLNNKDLWMEGDEIIERLNEKVRKFEEKAEEIDNEQMELELESDTISIEV
jgi:ATP-dependent protease ClpP protease subunit